MFLAHPTTTHLNELSTWFKSKEEVITWGGPGIRFPIEQKNFHGDLKLETLHSFVLLSQHNELIGFGQFYRRLDHCHLGRLVISPQHRGEGHVKTLIRLLSKQGEKTLGLAAVSLFVFSNNIPAISAYQKLGFKELPYPEQNPLEGCIYMVRKNSKER